MLQKYKLNPALGHWVQHQRQNRKNRKNSRHSEERIAKLDNIGFSWGGVRANPGWHVMYKELKAFKKRVRAILFLLLKIYCNEMSHDVYSFFCTIDFRMATAMFQG
jgi:hypothetical protein